MHECGRSITPLPAGDLLQHVLRHATNVGYFFEKPVRAPSGAHNRPARRVLAQERGKRGPKVYSLHAPELECIGTGKAHKPYEFGVKVSVAPPAAWENSLALRTVLSAILWRGVA
jgi:hypothetical protein